MAKIDKLEAVDFTSRLSSNVVILVTFPHQLLHALCVMNYLTLKNSNATIIYWSYRSADHQNKQAFNLLTEMCASFKSIRLECPSYFERVFLMSQNLPIFIRSVYLMWKFGRNQYSHILFSHDISEDHMAQAFMQAWPNSQKVCYGDPPGFLYSGDNNKKYENVFRKILNWWRRLFLKNWYQADLNFASVELYRSRSFPVLHDLIPRNILKSTHNDICNSIRASGYGRTTTEVARSRMAILLLGNFSRSKMMSLKSEIEMYSETIRLLADKYRIYVKPHPGNSSRFVRKLKAECKIMGVDFVDFVSTLPAEIGVDILCPGEIFSFSSNTALLKALNNVNCTFLLGNDIIEKYFYPEHKVYAREVASGLSRSSH